MMKLTFVIPAFNEEAGIGPTLDSIPTDKLWAAGYEVEKLVVDNRSTDRTAHIAFRHGARVISQPMRGYGNAYQAGFAAANGDIIISGDADMTYPFDAVPAILRKFIRDDLDFLTTDRLTTLNPAAMSWSHIVGNYILSFIMHFLFGAPFKDSQSGMWIFKRSIWPSLDTRHPGMPFSQEIKVDAYTMGFRCAEVPIEYRQRMGKEKLSIIDAWRTLSELFKKRIVLRDRTQTANRTQTAIWRPLPRDIE
jgi:glycosyltransferase involved in cell wall biosynthesis